MGRLSEYFNQHRDNVEEAVAEVLKKADSTIESLDRKVKELEQKLRDVAGEQPQNESNIQAQETEEEKQRREQEEAHNTGVVTSDQTNGVDTAAQADKSARSKRSR
jgi:hypothetical protein